MWSAPDSTCKSDPLPEVRPISDPEVIILEFSGPGLVVHGGGITRQVIIGHGSISRVHIHQKSV